MEKRGIDVSKWQGNIDWKKVKASGIEFAMIRIGYGSRLSQKDAFFETNYENAKAAGIPIGGYVYSYAKNAAYAKEEAKCCLEWIKGKKFEYPIVFDIEENSVAALGKETVNEIIEAFCSTVEAAGYYVMVYSSKHWFDSYISKNNKAKYDSWVAQWANNLSYKGPCGIWQYTSSGTVNGINGRVDMNIAYKDYETIIKRKGLNGFSTSDAPAKTEKEVELDEKYRAGDMLTLNNTPIYVSATAKKPSGYKSGKYYVYEDHNIINGRIRITNSLDRVGKKPVGENVTGFMEVE